MNGTPNCDANDHTSEWWPDNPETDEGLNWDIRYTNVADAFDWSFRRPDGSPPGSRLVDIWYVIDEIDQDLADGSTMGALVIAITGKDVGTSDGIADIEIRATGSGAAVASHEVNLQVIKV